MNQGMLEAETACWFCSVDKFGMHGESQQASHLSLNTTCDCNIRAYIFLTKKKKERKRYGDTKDAPFFVGKKHLLGIVFTLFLF